jgi:aminopeptidase-like protein
MNMKNQYLVQAEGLMSFIRTVWDLPRSITGDGVRKTLNEAKKLIPELQIEEVPTGTIAYDWEIPKEWVFRSAQILDDKNNVIVDSRNSNLHVVSYSVPVNEILSLEELQLKLHSDPSLPNAIPYRTSYYKSDWGFCVTQKTRDSLRSGNYRVVIDADFIQGSMTMGSIFIPGKVESEILFTTYICHPSLANNELSGPAIALGIANYLRSLEPYYSYRVLLVPETIGSIYYLSRNFDSLKRNLIAGYVLTCLGDEKSWNYLPSRTGITISDKIAKRVLFKQNIAFNSNSFLSRGSDERQYSSPNIDLPVCSVMRSRYGTYKEYHTSLDNLDFISKKGLSESLFFYTELIKEFESNRIPKATTFGEPMFSKRQLRSNLGGGNLSNNEMLISNVMAYADGNNDTTEMAELFDVSKKDLSDVIKNLIDNDLIQYR